ncbi:hypothetical protein LCGC14_2676300, partial [marine sediment metagenome]
GDMNPLWGAAASGIVGTGTAIGVRAATGMDKHAELIGLGTGVLTGIALMMSPRTRAAGFTGVVVAIVNNGFRFMEQLASDKQKIRDLAGAKAHFAANTATTKVPLKTQLTLLQAEAQSGGFGMVTVDPRQLAGGLGAVSAQQVPTLGAVSAQSMPLAGPNGLGIVSPEVIRTLGQSGVQFQGGGDSGPGVSGIGRHYGATVLG